MENLTAICCTLALIVCVLFVTGNLPVKPRAFQPTKKEALQKPSLPAPPRSDIEIFVSSECHHCVSMKPEIDKLQEQVRDAGLTFRLVIPADADIDAMMQSRNVQYFPLILLKGQPYQGERTAAAILEKIKTM